MILLDRKTGRISRDYFGKESTNTLATFLLTPQEQDGGHGGGELQVLGQTQGT